MCHICNVYGKIPFHIFYKTDRVKCLWFGITSIQYFQNSSILPTLTPQTAIFVILDSVSYDSLFENNKVFIDPILLVFMLYVYKFRERNFTNTNNLIVEIRKVKRAETEIALTDSKKTIALTKK